MNQLTPADTVSAALAPLHRLEYDPVAPPHPVKQPDGSPAWRVSRYADVRQVLSDDGFGRAELYAADAPSLAQARAMVDSPDLLFNQDGESHLRLRRTLRRAFTPRAVARWRPWIAEIVDGLLVDLARGPNPVDIVARFALPLPIAVITRLMGLDASHHERLRHWSEMALSNDSGPASQSRTALAEFAAYGEELLAVRRREPGDDLVSGLVRAADEEGGIPEAQLATLVCGLVAGGHDSTMTMISNSLLYLLSERPESWPRLAADEEAAQTAAARLLHMIPLGDDRGSARRAAKDVEVGGVLIPAGAVVLAECGAANRDPEVFTADRAQDLFSPLEAPTLSFGAGPHYCLGAWLARLELHLALHRLATEFPTLHLTEPVEEVRWRLGSTSRGPLELMVGW